MVCSRSGNLRPYSQSGPSVADAVEGGRYRKMVLISVQGREGDGVGRHHLSNQDERGQGGTPRYLKLVSHIVNLSCKGT